MGLLQTLLLNARTLVAGTRPPRDPRQVPLRRRRPGLRRLASAGLAAGAVACALQVLAPDPPPGIGSLVAARDLPAGTTLAAADVQSVLLPAARRPSGAVAPGGATGRVLASGTRAGEVLTDVRLVGAGLLAGQPGQVAAPVRVADPAAAALAVPGDRVDVLVATQGRPDAEVVVRAATVLAGPATTSDSGDLLSGDGGLGAGGPSAGSLGAGGVDTSGGGLLVLAVESVQAGRLAGAAARGVLSITLLPAPLLPPP